MKKILVWFTTFLILFVILGSDVRSWPGLGINLSHPPLPHSFFGKTQRGRYRIITRCEKAYGNFYGHIEIWSVDKKELFYDLDSMITQDGESSELGGWVLNVNLNCGIAGEVVTERKLYGIRMTDTNPKAKKQDFPAHLLAECVDYVRESETTSRKEGYPVLEYHKGKEKSSLILWKIDLRDYPLPDNSHLTCVTTEIHLIA